MNVGILGTGNIAHIVADTLNQMGSASCFAVASREVEKAYFFSKEFGCRKFYGSYEELVLDPDVDLVYIATPNTQHYPCMMLCIANKKPVLCEKAFTINSKQAKEVMHQATENTSFVAEAMWTRYMPSRAIIDEILSRNLIGKIQYLTANLSYVTNGKTRIVSPQLGGGALLDVGVYGLNFALMHFGTDIDHIESKMDLFETGVDGSEEIKLYYRDGRKAVLHHSICSTSDRKGIIYGDQGYIVVENLNNPKSIDVFDSSNRLLFHNESPTAISGYEYEFEACARALASGQIQVPEMPLTESIKEMELLDEIREQWKFSYPCELGMKESVQV